ncbi:MAG: DUF1553 domain-containing protein [Bacteroidia bacterium]|nr:DUF1553 domain-containing protein [Bacteroidia bacterium]
MLIRTTLYFLFLAALVACGLPDSKKVSFNRDIRPILNQHCLACHGGVKKSGEFSLLFREEAMDTAESGKLAIIPGDAQNSELILRLRHHDPELRMPLEADPLSPDQIRLIEKWIRQGAHWEDHWAYIPPDTTISPPNLTLPGKTLTDIDKFLLEKMKEKNLSFSPEASKPEMLRRLALDLTGLPPTEEELARFLNDSSPDAWEKRVDEYLHSPHFGEKWASLWLDLARYADSKGYEKDLNRSIWKYRDWVIQAYNRDMPFDSFTLYQLAGDLIPQPTESQLIATAFHRNTMANDEGGTDDEEFRVAAQIERVGTTGEVWLGTTLACVQCHSHPYDPFRHEDFYRFMAFFNNTADKDIYNEQPKIFTYEDSVKGKVSDILDWIEKKSDDPPKRLSSSSLHNRTTQTLYQMGFRRVEAEEYQDHSRFIELTSPDQLSVFQIQDSSWIMYENVDMTAVERMSFRISSQKAGGWIDVYVDSLYGEKQASIKVPVTRDWKKWQVIQTPVRPVKGKHNLYLSFRMNGIPESDLFRIDWLEYHLKNPEWEKYGPEMKNQLETLATLPTVQTPIFQELQGDQRRKTFHFLRGNWLTPGEEVLPGVPGSLPPLSSESPEDRLALARWMTHPNHPLTSRVYVNRIWAQIFGTGIVETTEDFGTQAPLPSHPELLDWLAVAFVRKHQWSTQALVKEIVMSTAYRQASTVSPRLLAIDPANRLLARGPRVRMSAEQIRDQALAVSGLLDKTIGGPPVLLNIPDKRTVDPYKQAELMDYQPYRRAVYNFWKRTIPTTLLTTFDAPVRDFCVSRRISTNTPLQSLVLLNDSVFFEAAMVLGEWMEKQEEIPETTIQKAYQKVLFRQPDTLRIDALLRLYEETEAAENAPCGYTMVANALLNLDVFINK